MEYTVWKREGQSQIMLSNECCAGKKPNKETRCIRDRWDRVFEFLVNGEVMGPILSRGKQRLWGGSLPAVIKADKKMAAVVGEEWKRLGAVLEGFTKL